MKAMKKNLIGDPLNYNQGLTLIELLIVLMMLSFVLFIGYSLYFLGVKSFTSGINKSDAQFEARKALQTITTNARTTTKVRLLNALPGTLNAGYQYFYIDNGLLKTDTSTTDPQVIAGIAGQVEFTDVDFTSPAKGLLRIELDYEAGEGSNLQTNNIFTEIKLLNMQSMDLASTGDNVLEIKQ